MVFLFSLSLLFLFISSSIGYWIKINVDSSTSTNLELLEILLIGIAAQTVFLNIISIFIPCNFLLLIPLFIFSLFISSKYSFISASIKTFRKNRGILFNKNNWIVTVSFLVVLILFTIVPPYNTDSSGYHFLSILWNEKYRAVPGLANLFPQYGYNSSFFVLSAAYSFTAVFKQSIYPINFVIITVFFTWLLKKSFQYDGLKKLLIWLLLIIFLRQFPINLASPSADALSSVVVFYILISLFEKRQLYVDFKDWKVLIMLALFSVIIKLSTLPLLLVAVVPLVIYKSDFKNLVRHYIRLVPVALLIVVPWLIRNVILSGYLIFPLPSINIFSVDWKVPLDIAINERLHISHAPRMISDNLSYVDKLGFFTWFPKWLPKVWEDNPVNFIIVILGLLSPLLARAVFNKLKHKNFALAAWIISYIGVWFWMISSPDIRFGYHYLLPCIFFPLLIIAEQFSYHVNALLISCAVCLVCFYYDHMAMNMLKPYSISQYIFRPLKSPEYFKNNNLHTFKYVILNNNTKLYIHDSAHHSINAPLPSCSPYRPGITMRGNKLQDGFKTVP